MIKMSKTETIDKIFKLSTVEVILLRNDLISKSIGQDLFYGNDFDMKDNDLMDIIRRLDRLIPKLRRYETKEKSKLIDEILVLEYEKNISNLKCINEIKIKLIELNNKLNR